MSWRLAPIDAGPLRSRAAPARCSCCCTARCTLLGCPTASRSWPMPGHDQTSGAGCRRKEAALGPDSPAWRSRGAGI